VTGKHNSFGKCPKHYYDAFENTITEVDAKGNSTVTWYDGAGREVKTGKL